MAPLPDLGDLFKDLVWDLLVKAALSKLFAAIPWLGWGPVGILVGWIVGMLADYLYDAVKMTIDLQVIAFKNEQHRREYDKAGVTLKLIARDKGIDSPEFKAARDENKKSLSRFVTFA